ncbi:MAG: T9SS type A sorting domain-containing protein [Bacteroidota bacterium]
MFFRGHSGTKTAFITGGAVLAAFLAFNAHVTRRVDIPKPGGESVLERVEDLRARESFDWMRLHDPATGKIPEGIRQRELAFAAKLPKRDQRSGLEKSTGGAALTWNKRGPYNIGGRTRAFAVDVSNPNVILAGGVSGGMWRSTDRGVTWTKTTTPQQLHSVTCIAQDTRSGHTSTWYYGTGEYRGNSANGGGSPYQGDGIFKSTDGGVTWTLLSSTTNGNPQSWSGAFDYVWSIAVDPSNMAQEEVYVATPGAIVRSTDGGTSWSTVLGLLSNSYPRFTDVAVTSAGVVYAALSELRIDGSASATSRGIWRSPDGTSWTNITPATWPTTYRRIVIGIAPSNESILYLLADSPGSGFQTTYAGAAEAHNFWKYKYVSGDGSGAGGVWTNRSSNLPNFGQPVGDFASQGSYDLIVKVKPDDTNAVFIGGTNLYRSTNGFSTTGATTWIGGYATVNNISQYSNHHPDQHGLVFSPDNALQLYSSHDGGVSSTLNCLAAPMTWTTLNNGYQTTQFYTIAIDHGTSGSNSILGGMQDNGVWEVNAAPGTTPWSEVATGDGAYCYVNDGRSAYIASIQNGLSYRIRVSDGAWTRIDPTGGSGYLFINPGANDPNTNTIMYVGAGSSLWRNSNLDGITYDFSASTKSTNWTNLTSAGISGSTISALAMSRTPGNRLYYGSTNGRVYRLDNASAATTSTVPVDVWTAKGLPAAYVSSIAVDPTNADVALLTFSNYNTQSVFLTTNAGSTWTDVEGNLAGTTGPSVRWASIVPYGGSTTYFVGTSTGLYATNTLNGVSTVWAQEGAATIGNVVVDMIDYRLSDGFVVVATHGQGVFSTNIIPSGVEEFTRPQFAALYQNYPNPFNPSTTIRFRLAATGDATLKVYAVTGQEVATLVDGELGEGDHEVSWAPAHLGSGTYFYTLRSGEFSQSRTLMLLK